MPQGKHGHGANQSRFQLQGIYCLCSFYFPFRVFIILLVGCSWATKNFPVWKHVPDGLKRWSWSNVETHFCAGSCFLFKDNGTSVFHSRWKRYFLLKADGLRVQERRMKRDHGGKGSWRCRDLRVESGWRSADKKLHRAICAKDRSDPS